MTSKQVTSPPWNSRRLVHSKEMAWASRWSVALRAFYRQILSSSNCKDFFFKWHRPPRKLAKEVFVKFIPAKEKTRFAKEWRKVLAKDHVIRIDSHEVFNTAQLDKIDPIKVNHSWIGEYTMVPYGSIHMERWQCLRDPLRFLEFNSNRNLTKIMIYYIPLYCYTYVLLYSCIFWVGY